MSMKKQCCRCQGHYTPVLGSSMIHCPMCEVAQRHAVEAATDYRRKIDSGDINVKPLNDNDARTVRRHIARRVASPPDCKPLRTPR